MRKSTLPKMTQIAPNLKQGLFSRSFSRYFFHVFWKLEYFQIRNFNRSIISIFIISIISILILYQLLLFPKSRFSSTLSWSHLIISQHARKEKEALILAKFHLPNKSCFLIWQEDLLWSTLNYKFMKNLFFSLYVLLYTFFTDTTTLAKSLSTTHCKVPNKLKFVSSS